ncbi:hypothetical protein HON22_02565 [Candidatus Peregrinibacteria bacterium]|jgi:hypothetical protein|nr:hypothetical protein [Candidatus Peregrinibacteria bacterium]
MDKKLLVIALISSLAFFSNTFADDGISKSGCRDKDSTNSEKTSQPVSCCGCNGVEYYSLTCTKEGCVHKSIEKKQGGSKKKWLKFI